MDKFLKIYGNLLFVLVVLLFVFIPIYPKFPLFNVKGTFVAIRLEDFIIALTVSLWAIYLVLSNKLQIFLKNKLTRALFLFFLIGGISTFSAYFLTHSVALHLSILNLLRRVEYMILMPLVATTVKDKKKLVLILILLSLTVFAVDIYALGQQYLDWPVISTTNSEFAKGQILRLTPGARVSSTFAGHYDLAVFLAMAIVVLTPLFFAVKKIVKIPVVILGAFSLLILIMTAARLSFVAAFIGVIAALILSRKAKYILLIAVLSAAILVYPSQLRDRFVSTITVNILNLGQRYKGQTQDQKIRSKLNIPTLAIKTSSSSAVTSTFATHSGTLSSDITPGEPVDTTQLGVYRSFEIRLNIEWPRAINAFLKNPLLGSGYSSIDIATDNDFLRSLGEVGILGTMAMALILTVIGKELTRLMKKENGFLKYFSAASLSLLIAFLVNGLFIDVFEASKAAEIFWMAIGLALAVENFKEAKN